MPRRLTIRLSNLYLDLQNPRYEEQKSQNEALNTIAREQKDKLIALLRDIIAHGLNPSDIPIVMPDPTRDSGYIVLEGNRRIAALKLLQKPAILTNATIRQKYSRLHDKHKRSMVKNIECLIVNSREEANLWILRKHEGEMSGIGTVRWDNVQKSRFMAGKTGKDGKAVQLIDFMKTAAKGDTEFEGQLQKVSATNLERFITTPDVRAKLGLEYSNGEYSSRYEWNEVLRGLKAIVSRFTRDDFNVRAIYHKEDRLKFLHEIPADELPDMTKKSEQPWKLKEFAESGGRWQKEASQGDTENQQKDKAGKESKQGDDRQEPRPTTRDTLVPGDVNFSIPSERINRIFNELKKLSHTAVPNACSVMLRVFLELSVDKYLEAFNLLKKDALTGAKDKRDLKQKTNAVIHHLQQKGRADLAMMKGIKTEISKDASPYSIDTMNAYVHNGDFNPIPENLMYTWDNMQPFFAALWKYINEKEK